MLKLLALPVTGPLKAVLHVAEEAQRTANDPATILAEYDRLKAARRAGEIGEDDWKRRKRALNERFQALQRRRSRS